METYAPLMLLSFPKSTLILMTTRKLFLSMPHFASETSLPITQYIPSNAFEPYWVSARFLPSLPLYK